MGEKRVIDSSTSKPAGKAGEFGDTSTPTFDVVKLLKNDDSKPGSTGAADEKKTGSAEESGAGKVEPDAGKDATAKSEGEAKKHAKRDDMHPKIPDTPYDIVHRPEDFDPHQPSVLFLDTWDKKRANNVDIGDGTRVPHGEISRRAAEESGYQTFALKYNQENAPGPVDSNFATALDKIGEQIKSGELPVGYGDVLNISLGNPGPTFANASKFLGFDVDPKNIQPDKVMARMREIAVDSSRPELDRLLAQRVVKTNEAIAKIQEQGVDVITSAGNTGPDSFKWEMMTAVNLSSNRPDGKADGFSADNSLSTAGDGVLPIHFENVGSLIDKTSIGEQKGRLAIGDTGASFPYKGDRAFVSDEKIFDRDTIVSNTDLEKIGAVKPEVSSRLTAAGILPDSDALLAGFNGPILNDAKPGGGGFTGSAEQPAKLEKIIPAVSFITQEEKVAQLGNGVLATAVLNGTSFSNIGFLRDNLKMYQDRKAEH